MIRSVTVAALCIMLSWLWWTQKLSMKKNTKSLQWWSNVHCLVCQSKPKVKNIKTLPHKLRHGSDSHTTGPPTSPVLQKVTINISILIAPAETSVFTHSRTEVEIEVEAINLVSEVIFIECNYSKIPIIWLTWDWTSARLLVFYIRWYIYWPKFSHVHFHYCSYTCAVQLSRGYLLHLLVHGHQCQLPCFLGSSYSSKLMLEIRSQKIPQRLMYRHSWRPCWTCPWDLPASLPKPFFLRLNAKHPPLGLHKYQIIRSKINRILLH